MNELEDARKLFEAQVCALYSFGFTHEQKGVKIHETNFTRHVFVLNDEKPNAKAYNQKVYDHIKDVWFIADMQDSVFNPIKHIEAKMSLVAKEYLSNVEKVVFKETQTGETMKRKFEIIPNDQNKPISLKTLAIDVSTGMLSSVSETFIPQVDFYFEYDKNEEKQLDKLVAIVEAPSGFAKQSFKCQILKSSVLVMVGERKDDFVSENDPVRQRAIQYSQMVYGKFRKEVKLPALPNETMKYNDNVKIVLDKEGCIELLITIEHIELL